MSDHGWKSMLARMSRWLASPVRVEFNPRARLGFGREVTIAPARADEPAPPRRGPIRFRLPDSDPAADRQRVRDAEFRRLVAEISRLTERHDGEPGTNG